MGLAEEGNKLIDLFLHPEYTINGDWILWNDEHGSRSHVSILSYHRSWDSLVPVVEKINKLFGEKARKLSKDWVGQKHIKNQLYNESHWKSWSYHCVELSTDIDYVFNQVVRSIQWYNSKAINVAQKR
jgi:hypothetical protein